MPEPIETIDEKTYKHPSRFSTCAKSHHHLPVSIHTPNRIHVAGDNLRIK